MRAEVSVAKGNLSILEFLLQLKHALSACAICKQRMITIQCTTQSSSILGKMTAVPAMLPSCALLERTSPSSAYKSCSAPILQQRQVAVQSPFQGRWMVGGCVCCAANALSLAQHKFCLQDHRYCIQWSIHGCDAVERRRTETKLASYLVNSFG